MAVKIIADSSIDVPTDVRTKLLTVPLTVFFSDGEYTDRVDMTDLEFYEKLAVSQEIPRTSQPSPERFAEIFRQVTENGDDGVVLTISSKVSGTYQSACLAAAEFAGHIYVVDTLTGSVGTGILAERALQMAEEGMTAAEISMHLEEEKKSVCLFGLVNTLENLRKSGRISKLKGMAAEALQIKPILTVRDGEIVFCNKAHGLKRGVKMMAEEVQKAGGIDIRKPFLMAYTGLSDEVSRKLEETLKPMITPYMERIRTTIVGSTIGTHIGAGAVIVAFFRKVKPAGV
ncbi:MAG: DegV family protein [Solobacterium sp.]|nr:DegV family protein [Solobacterium sp.]